jgi:hypothetical protein
MWPQGEGGEESGVAVQMNARWGSWVQRLVQLLIAS